MLDSSLVYLTISEARDAIRSGRLSPLELIQAHLARIEALNPKLNAYLEVAAEAALAQARAQTEELAGPGRHRGGPLHGIPVAIKDLYDVAGMRTTAGSVLLKENVARADSVAALRQRQAGAVLLGKLNLHEWALGVTNINPHFGACRNPWNLDYITGGSSGGSAAALAAGLCLGALGSDTGGSIRIPASLCGVVGLKPTYGRISLRGVTPLAWSLDHAGPLARTVDDAAILLQTLAGYDPEDPASAREADREIDWQAETGASGLRVGVPPASLLAGLHPEVEAAVRAAFAALPGLGCELREVALDGYDRASAASSTVLLAEAAAFHRERMAEHPEAIGPEVLPRFRAGAEISGTDYALARRTQAEWTRAMVRLFETVDLLVLPATPAPALPLADSDALKAAVLLTRFTRVFNLAGLPALSLPCGFTSIGLPIGLQIVGPAWAEARALRLAGAYEAAAGWHKQRPPI